MPPDGGGAYTRQRGEVRGFFECRPLSYFGFDERMLCYRRNMIDIVEGAAYLDPGNSSSEATVIALAEGLPRNFTRSPGRRGG
jgi:hypothetical protein